MLAFYQRTRTNIDLKSNLMVAFVLTSQNGHIFPGRIVEKDVGDFDLSLQLLGSHPLSATAVNGRDPKFENF